MFQLSIMMIPELVPKPYMFMFFALFNISGKSSGFVGPFITSRIIDNAGGNPNVSKSACPHHAHLGCTDHLPPV